MTWIFILHVSIRYDNCHSNMNYYIPLFLLFAYAGVPGGVEAYRREVHSFQWKALRSKQIGFQSEPCHLGTVLLKCSSSLS